MDATEKRVIRWKRHLIASNVVWSEDFVRALKQRHLVSDGVLLQIEVSRLIWYGIYGSELFIWTIQL
jgi:hypothetical protein